MSGRPEKPIAADAPPHVRKLAEELRKLRADAGLPYSQLSRMAGVSTSALSRAASGQSVPSMEVVEAVAIAAGASPARLAELRQLREAAARPVQKVEEASRLDSLGITHETLLTAMKEGAQRYLLVALHAEAGAPSVREIANRTGLPRSTVHRALTGRSLAGAKEVAHNLVARLAPEDRKDWTVKVTDTFEGVTAPAAPAEKTPLFRATDAAGSREVDQAFADFVLSLRRVRNLIVHGQVETGAQFAAHVMELALLVRNDRIHPPLRGADPDPDAQAYSLPPSETLASNRTPGRRGGA
ncbi:helix-turn-helix domain-containing protein [Streptomyces mirabilis]|uniref:helix-turn-helix domain-containing protein n=1 Tax=Streptomyces mirabilis TaxID=68239 RepID=UPI0036AD042A